MAGIEIAFGSVASIITAVVSTFILAKGRGIQSSLKRQRVEEKVRTEALMALLRAKLRIYHADARNRGFISPRDFSDVETIHKSYKRLGGNGEGDRMRREMEGMIRYDD